MASFGRMRRMNGFQRRSEVKARRFKGAPCVKRTRFLVTWKVILPLTQNRGTGGVGQGHSTKADLVKVNQVAVAGSKVGFNMQLTMCLSGSAFCHL